MGKWGITWFAQQHERDENVVHIANPGSYVVNEYPGAEEMR